MVASSRPLQMISVVQTGVRLVFFGLLIALPAGSCGCAWDDWHFNDIHLVPLPAPPPGPADSLVLRGDNLEAQHGPADAKVAVELDGATSSTGSATMKMRRSCSMTLRTTSTIRRKSPKKRATTRPSVFAGATPIRRPATYITSC